MAELIASRVDRLASRQPRDFVLDGCQRIDRRLRAGPPTTRPERNRR